MTSEKTKKRSKGASEVSEIEVDITEKDVYAIRYARKRIKEDEVFYHLAELEKKLKKIRKEEVSRDE